MSGFTAYVGVDYSGAATVHDRLPGLAAYRAAPGEEPRRVRPAKGGNWSRAELHRWLAEQLAAEPTIAGLDFAFAFPEGYFRRYHLPDWDAFLVDFRHHWPTDAPGVTVEACRPGNPRTGSPDELRLCERWTPAAKSVFRFDVQGAVAKSAHAGLPWLARLRRKQSGTVHFWPFDGFRPTPGKSLAVEVYPALFKRRFHPDGRNDHQQDAYAVARWLAETDTHGFLPRYLQPPLTSEETDTALREGWILGVS
ncbi:hypothetical protein [Thiohalorhabdus sp.]|uniref:hypothetical protein n=1 Tax=Thiohalorhabdus sp. TaxID=3094134 RepID=UPI002FC2D7AA